MCIELLVIFSDDGLNFCGICGDFPFIVFIASIWLFSLFFFINLVSGLCISLIFSKKQLLDLLTFWRVFHASISFSSALILVTSCLLLGFEFFLSCSSSSFNFDDRCQFWVSPFFSCGHLLLIFSSRDCFKCVPEILVCYVCILLGFKELLYFCLHFIVYPVNNKELVVQCPWSCAVLS